MDKSESGREIRFGAILILIFGLSQQIVDPMAV